MARRETAASARIAVPPRQAASARAIAQLTPAECETRGKTARSEVPRSSHAEWEPSAARPDPIALLEEQAVTRLPELVPIRHGRMLVSPLAFFRGAALIMAADLAATPHSGLRAQLCGDAVPGSSGRAGPRPSSCP